MSIINKVLQDLDKRHGRSGGESMAGDAVRSVKPPSRWKQGQNSLLPLAAVAALALAGGWWWMQKRNTAEQQIVVVSSTQVASTAPNPSDLVAKGTTATAETPAPQTPQPAQAPAPKVAAPQVPTPQAPVQSPTPQAPTQSAKAAAPQASVASAVVKPAQANNPELARAETRALAKVPATAAAVAADDKAPSVSVASNVAEPATKQELSAARQLPSAGTRKATAGKAYSPAQVASNLMAEAVVLEQRGLLQEAKLPLQKALETNPLDVAARQMLVQLNLDTGRTDEARALVTEGYRLLPGQPQFTLAMARMQIDAGDAPGALKLLESGSAAARDDPRYHAFLAALLLRDKRHDEAVQHYLVALRADPANPTWLVGIGMALEGAGKPTDAAEAYLRAETSPNLAPETAKFLSDRLTQLRR